MISKIRSAGAATAIALAITGGIGMFGPAAANAQSSSPDGTLACGLSQGILHWAYTNCGNSNALVRFHHSPWNGSGSWDQTLCIGKGQVVTVGNAGLELVTATELQGPCIPR